MSEKAESAVFVLPTPTLGGAERITQIVAEHLGSMGYRVTIYCIARGTREEWRSLVGSSGLDVRVGEYRSEASGLWSTIMFLIRISRTERLAYVWSSHTHVNTLLSLLRRLRMIRCGSLIARESTRIFDRFRGMKRVTFWLMYQIGYGGQDLLICQTNDMNRSLLSALGRKPVKNIAVIPNPYVRRSDSKKAVKPAPYRTGERIIIACGRLIKVKGFDILIDAFGIAAREMPNVRLVILGDGPEKGALEAQVAQQGLSDAVDIVGYEPDAESWFASADVGVVSSRSEGFPNVILEMMASGVKNIVSTPCSDGINDLPDISICRDFSAQEMASRLLICLNEGSHSASYQRYVWGERSVQEYWRRICSELQGHAI